MIKTIRMRNILLSVFILVLGLETKAQNKIDDKILLVLDIQKLFTSTTISDSSAMSLIDNSNSIISKFNPNNVIYIQSIARVLNVSLKGFRVDTLPDLELDPRLNVVNNNIFTKNKGNAFTSEELNSFVEKSSIKEIIVIGLLAENCVKETLLGGKKKGYTMYYIPEAIAAKNKESKTNTEAKFRKSEIIEMSISQIVNLK